MFNINNGNIEFNNQVRVPNACKPILTEIFQIEFERTNSTAMTKTSFGQMFNIIRKLQIDNPGLSIAELEKLILSEHKETSAAVVENAA